MITADEGQITTVEVDPYLTTFSSPALEGPGINGEALTFTGRVHYLAAPYLVRMDLLTDKDEWIIFDLDDVTELKGN